jgi:FlaA1/EpsC-like NDP-sugar epimerase
MNKNINFYAAIWAVILVLYNVIVFMVRPVLPLVSEAYDAGFWVAWAVAMAAFICNLICAYITFHGDNLEKTFYRVPLVHMSYTCLISMLVVGGVLMLIPSCPVWISAVVCVAAFLLQIISIVKSGWAASAVETTEQRVQSQTSFILEITADAEQLISNAQTDEARASCRKVYEALRYSDPMSGGELTEIETEIRRKFEVLSEKVKSGEKFTAAFDELMSLISDRSSKCKLMKRK